MNIVLIIVIIVLILIIIAGAIVFYILYKKKKAKIEEKDKKDQDNNNQKPNASEVRITQDDIYTFASSLSPEDELGQYIIATLKKDQTISEAQKTLYNPDSLKGFISEKLKLANINTDNSKYKITNDNIMSLAANTAANDELGQYIAAMLKPDSTVEQTMNELLDSDHIKMILSNKLKDLLTHIGEKKTKETENINDINKYIESSLMKSMPKSQITNNLLEAGYDLGQINSILYSNTSPQEAADMQEKESNKVKEELKEQKNEPLNELDLRLKEYIKKKIAENQCHKYIKEVLLLVGHDRNHIEKLIEEVKREEITNKYRSYIREYIRASLDKKFELALIKKALINAKYDKNLIEEEIAPFEEIKNSIKA